MHDYLSEMKTSRRAVLQSAACGFGALAATDLLARTGLAATESSGLLEPHFAPRAKRVIFIFMQGGPSQVDTFDHKPRLAQDDGKAMEFDVARTRQRTAEKILKSPWNFQKHGECGQWVSELFPEVARHVDDICLLSGMHTEGVAHGPATLFLHTGATNLARPSVGSWISYGLGSENQNLPAFITINPSAAKGGPRNYGSAFLPASHQGTALGRAGLPAKGVRFQNVSNEALSAGDQRRQFELLQSINREQLKSLERPHIEMEGAIESFEMAYRMQATAPQLFDLTRETAATQASYGIGAEPTDDFGRQCLMARRMAEAGVRFIQINYADNTATPRWDQHSKLMQHEEHSLATDKPVAALLADLKQRGLLEDTLVWWGGEFGRTPYAQGRDGRDHNPKGFTVWLAGGGVKQGLSYGVTDEFGYEAVDQKIHMHDLHATILHLLGLDHERLTYRYAGRDFRLTDVAGRVVHDLFA